MSERTRQGLAVLSAALAVGIAAEVLHRAVPGRLDLALGLAVLALAIGALVYRRQVPVPAGLATLALPFGFLLPALIWRDSPTLFALNLLGIGLLVACASPRVRGVGRRRAGLGDLTLGGLQAAAGTAAGAAPLLFGEIDWRSLPAEGPAHRLRGLALGLLLATPVVLLFAGLLMEADPVFDRLMGAALAPGLERLVQHGWGAAVWAWLAAGSLRLLLLRVPDSPGAAAPRGGRFTLMEVGTVLLVVDLLFLAFVGVQFRYLFGGAELVQGLTGLTYAEYAREGFFQLVTVAALSLPLLLAADWALGRAEPGARRGFRRLASVMLVLLNVMLASALWRMWLYTAEYGLTELRFYTTAFMGWLVLVLGWLAATVLRGRRERFGFGAVAAAFFVLAALNLVNPDGLIARTNLARAAGGRAVDTVYLSRLSADAVPAMLHGRWQLPPAERCRTAAALAQRWTPELEQPGRWNIALSRASPLLARPPAGCPNPGGR